MVKNTYDFTWETAIENDANYVMIATWNEFFEGTAIQPSKQFGDTYLKSTKNWITEFKNP